MNKKKISRRQFAKKTSIAGVSMAVLPHVMKSETNSNKNQGYDYIVVGSGAGGGPLASNLARHGFKVLVLEAGSKDPKTDTYRIPAYHTFASEDKDLSWSYYVKHYSGERATLDSKYVPNKGILYPRGATIGGSTAVNALITVYPHASDFEYIADLTGDHSWRAPNMRKYLTYLENCEYLREDEALAEGHGVDGWLPTNYNNFNINTLLDNAATGGVILSNLAKHGRNITDLLFNEKSFDVNQRSFEQGAEGAILVPQCMDQKSQRHAVREFLLDTAEKYPENLTIITDALVQKVVFNENNEAIGVEYIKGKGLYEADPDFNEDKPVNDPVFVQASREIILSAGAFNTPQILQLSGIGDTDFLSKNGIDTVVDLPGVGKNLQDRYELGVVYELKGRILSDCTFSQDESDQCLNDYNNDASGAYTGNGAISANIIRSNPDLPDPDLFNFCLTTDFRGYAPGYSNAIVTSKDKLTWAILKGHTNNTGEVNIKNKDPRSTPDINFKYFSDGENIKDGDMDALLAGVDHVRDIMSSPLVNLTIEEEVWPGEGLTDKNELTEFIANEVWGHHASCTCKIGNGDDKYDVLDSNFKVRGVDKLRVVDASVFPKIPGFFIVTPIYLISEKATDAILADAGVERKDNLLRSGIRSFVRKRNDNKLQNIEAVAFPNPFTDNLEFKIGKELYENESVDVSIINLSGQIVKKKTITNLKQNKISLDVSNLSSGNYIYSLLFSGGVSKTGKINKSI